MGELTQTDKVIQFAQRVNQAANNSDPSADQRVNRCVMLAIGLGWLGGYLFARSLLRGGSGIEISAGVSLSGLGVVLWAANQNRRKFSILRDANKRVMKKVRKIEGNPDYGAIVHASGGHLSRLVREMEGVEINGASFNGIQQRINGTQSETKRIWKASAPLLFILGLGIALSLRACFLTDPAVVSLGMGGMSASLVALIAVTLRCTAFAARQQFLRDSLRQELSNKITHAWNTGNFALPENPSEIDCIHLNANTEVTQAQLGQLQAHRVKKFEGRVAPNLIQYLADQPLERLRLLGDDVTLADLAPLTNVRHLKSVRVNSLGNGFGDVARRLTALEHLELGVGGGGLQALSQLGSLKRLEMGGNGAIRVTDLPTTIEALTVGRLQAVIVDPDALRYNYPDLDKVVIGRTNNASMAALRQLKTMTRFELKNIADNVPHNALYFLREETGSIRERVTEVTLDQIQAFDRDDILWLVEDGRTSISKWEDGDWVKVEGVTELRDLWDSEVTTRVRFKEAANPMMGG